MFKILSIDGGGMKGTFAAAFLDELQNSLDAPIGDYFDLISGTSTGGIIALGLGLGLGTAEVLNIYKANASTIFPKSRMPWWLTRWNSKYGSQGLQEVLKLHFESRLLGESRYRLMIPALEENTGRVHIYKNAYHERLRTDYKKKATEVALATAAAPIYLPAHESDSGLTLLDGGIWANNPAAIATAEAVGLLQIPCNEVRILTIGTTDSPVGKRPKDWNIMARKDHMLAISFAAQSSGSLGIAKTLIGGDSVFRINLMLGSGLAALDQTENLSVLEGLGRAEGRRASTRLRQPFFSQTAPPFTPVYSLPVG